MHISDEERQAQLKALVVEKARDIIARKDEIADTRRTARALWQGMLAAPTWQIVPAERPPDFEEPDEIWTETPRIVRR